MILVPTCTIGNVSVAHVATGGVGGRCIVSLLACASAPGMYQVPSILVLLVVQVLVLVLLVLVLM